jgi:hypothetical protein
MAVQKSVGGAWGSVSKKETNSHEGQRRARERKLKNKQARKATGQ